MSKVSKSALLLTLALTAAGAAARPSAAQDKPKVAVSAEHSPADVLRTAKEGDLKVVVVLKNGMSYSASVKETGAHAVVLKNPAGKEFYEVYVVLAEIASIEVRVRDR